MGAIDLYTLMTFNFNFNALLPQWIPVPLKEAEGTNVFVLAVASREA